MTKPTLVLGPSGKFVVRNPDGSALPLSAVDTRPKSAVPHIAFLLLDCSGSMAAAMLEAISGARQFSRDAIESRYSVGIIRFAADAEVLCRPTRELNTLEAAIGGLAPDGSTNMTDAITLATRSLGPGPARRAMVLVTDGAPDDRHTTLDAALRAREAGVDIIAIGTGEADHAFLATLASRHDLAVSVARKELASSMRAAALMLPGAKASR